MCLLRVLSEICLIVFLLLIFLFVFLKSRLFLQIGLYVFSEAEGLPLFSFTAIEIRDTELTQNL